MRSVFSYRFEFECDTAKDGWAEWKHNAPPALP